MVCRCEVQFDYGLRQKRHLKLETRPTSFVSSEGKVIEVSKDVAVVNDRTLTRGKVKFALEYRLCEWKGLTRIPVRAQDS